MKRGEFGISIFIQGRGVSPSVRIKGGGLLVGRDRKETRFIGYEKEGRGVEGSFLDHILPRVGWESLKS